MKNIAAIANIIALSVIVAWSSAATARPASTKLAAELIDQSKYTEAIATCTRLINGGAKDKAAAFCLRGATYGYLKQYQKAVSDCTKGLNLNDRDSYGYAVRGQAYNYLQQHQYAIADCSKAIELDPSYAKAYFNRANAYASLKDYERAKTDYSRSIQLKIGELSFAYGNRGLISERLGKFADALADYNRALALDPKSSWICYHRAELNRKLHNYAAALNDCQRALRADPKDANIYLLCGKIDEDLRLYQLAILNMNAAIRLSSEPNYCAYAHRAICRIAVGAHKNGMADLDQALSQIKIRIANLWQREQKNELHAYTRWLYTTRGWHRNQNRDQQGALSDYNESIKLGSKDPFDYHERGYIYFDRKLFSEAVRDANIAISLAKQNESWPHYFLRGRAQAALGQNIAVIESFNSVIEQLDWSATSEAHRYRGNAKFAAQDYLGGTFDFGESIACKYLGRYYSNVQRLLHNFLRTSSLTRITSNSLSRLVQLFPLQP